MLYMNYLLKYKLNIFKYIKIVNISSNYDKLTQEMSNIFKSNSRFSSLIDDMPQQKKDSKKESKRELKNDEKKEPEEERFNTFKSERPLRTESNYRGFSDRGRERYRLEREAEIKAQKELEEREKERIRHESLKIDNFPDLVTTSKKENNEVNTKISYIETLKKEEEEIKDNIDKDLENLKPGWILLKKDPLTRRIIIKKHPETDIEEKKEEKTDKEIGMDIVNALVELHQKRTDEYIENYGYDEWERMFKFPDWREREAYLEAMEEMEDETDESEHEHDYEYT